MTIEDIYTAGGIQALADHLGVSNHMACQRLKENAVLPNFCECGCGARTKNYTKYLAGHNPTKPISHSKQTKKNISEKAKERFRNRQKVNGKIYDIPSKEDLEYLHYERMMSLNQMKDLLTTSIPTIKKWMKGYNIIWRNIQEANKVALQTASRVKEEIELPHDDIIFLYNEKKYSTDKISTMMSVSPTTVLNRLHDNNISTSEYRQSNGEVEIIELLERNNIDFINNAFDIIPPKEIDICIPDRNIAIEYNGITWHSETSPFGTTTKNKDYHLQKTVQCEEKGIRLFHIFDNEWNDITRRKVWESVILNSLGIHSLTIGARQTIVERISSKAANDFCATNHLQGKSFSSINYGLVFKGELVSVMTFAKSRYNKKISYELMRFAVKRHTKVHGAASKLLKAFQKEHTGSIISYANRRWSKGDLYEKLGFTFSHSTSPNYFYWSNARNLESRIKYQKHKLKSVLSNFNPELTEWENMKKNGYNRIFDCGNLVYVLG